jgi:four helix bundle protein
MSSVERFEDIEAWKKARELTKSIYRLTSVGEFARDFGLRDQIRRASVSVMSNIAEGFERDGDKEFQQFWAMAKGSAGEVKTQLYVALDADFLSQGDFDSLYALANEISRLTSGLIRYLNNSNYKGSKYK